MENGLVYARAGQAYAEAWTLLRDGCEIPPSFEVFMCELRQRRTNGAVLSPYELARQLVRDYRRIL